MEKARELLKRIHEIEASDRSEPDKNRLIAELEQKILRVLE